MVSQGKYNDRIRIRVMDPQFFVSEETGLMIRKRFVVSESIPTQFEAGVDA